MKFNKILLISIVLLVLLSLGAVSAQDNITDITTNQNDSKQLNLDDNSKLTDGASTYNKEVYVNATGSDSGAGSKVSPYATINKAISDVNASDNAVIYLSSGTYSGDGNTNLEISLSHKNYGGTLTFIGASDSSTIIDGNEISPIFKSISADSIIILKNIVFTKGKNALGSAITTSGNITIENCIFENNYATTLGALYFNGANDFTLINTTFINNFGSNGYADLYSSYSGSYKAKVINCSFIGSKAGNTNLPSFSIQNFETYIVGNTFKDLTGGNTAGTFQISYGSAPRYIINNTFINCNYTGSGVGGIFACQNSYLERNIFINCTTKSAEIYAQTEFNAKIKFLNISVDGTTFRLYANVTDDMDHIITTGGDVYFYINGVMIGKATATKGVATISVSKLYDNGEYNISGDYKYSNNPFDVEVENGTLTVDFNHDPLELWVSPNGNDTNGTGSETNPFLTLKHAIDYGFANTIDLTIHMKDGVYNGSANRGLSYSPVGKLTIIGESYGKTIIDAEKAGSTIFTFGPNLEVKMTNLTLLNTTGRVISVYTLELTNSIIKNVGSFYAQNTDAKILFNNVTYLNSGALQMYNPTIYNCKFINNDGKTSTGLIWAASNNGNIITIENTIFINNTIAGYSGGAAYYIQGPSRLVNNIYINNTVTGSGTSIAYVSGNNITSINETFIGNGATSYIGYYYLLNTDPQLNINNITFINNTASDNCAGLAISGGNVTKAKFINNTATNNGGAIYLLYHQTSTKIPSLILKDVEFENNKATRGSDIFIQEPTSTSYTAGELENLTITAQNKTTDLLADTLIVTVSHESGAIIGGGEITFFIDNNKIGSSKLNNGEAIFEYLGFKNGIYNFTESYSLNKTTYKHENATITVNLKPLLDNITLYVSDSRGDDVNGDGSFNNPYKTIQTALSSGYAQSPVVIVKILEGSYIGEKNVNLDIPTGLDITIAGEGTDKTFINDTNAEYFIKALAGDESLKIANLTVNRTGKRLNQMITIVNGARVTLDNVYITRGIGNDGGAIRNDGTLNIINSYFYNNGLGESGFTSRAGGAIYNTGILIIKNTIFYANHASGAAGGYGGAVIYNTGDLEIYSSILNDSICDYGMNMAYMAIQGTATSTIKMYDTLVTITGRTAAEILPTDLYNLNGRAVPTIGIGQAASGLFVNCTFDGANVLNHAGTVVFGNINNWNPVNIRNITVINSTFKDLKAPTVIYSTNAGNLPDSYRIFEGCLFDNVEFLYATLTNSAKVHISIKNSVILPNGTQMIGGPAIENSDITNNWWGSNSGVYDLTTITRVNGGSNSFYNIKANVKTTTALKNWIELTATKDEKDIALEFKLFDGETYTEYTDGLIKRLFTVSAVNGTLGIENGTISKKVIIPFEATDSRYSITVTVDDEVITLAYDERNETLIDVIGINKDLGIVTVLTDINGTPISGAEIYYTIGDLIGNLTTDENGTVIIPCTENGKYSIIFKETDKLLGSNTTFNADGIIKSEVPVTILIPEDIEVGDTVPVIISIGNATGNVKLIIDGESQIAILEDGTASYNIKNIKAGMHTIVAIYDGDDNYSAVNTNKTFNIAKANTTIEVIAPKSSVVDKSVTISVDIDTSATGIVIFTINDEQIAISLEEAYSFNFTFNKAGTYNIYAKYLGDDYFNENTSDVITINITSKKESVINITLPNDIKAGSDVNAIINITNATGKITVIIDGKENKITLENGSANFPITAVEAGKHTITVVYNGDNAYGKYTTTFTAEKQATNINITLPTDYKVDENVNISISVPSSGNITVIIDGVEIIATLENNTAIIPFKATAGEHSIVVIYKGDETHDESYAKATMYVEVFSTSFVNITVTGDLKVSATLLDALGYNVGNATIIYTIGNVTYNTTTDDNGVFTIQGVADKLITINYDGNDYLIGTTASINLKDMIKEKSDMYIELESSTVTSYTVDISAGEKGSKWIVATIKDNNGIVKNTTVQFTFAGVKYDLTSDENGQVKFLINRDVGQTYTGTFVYLGDNTHNSNYTMVNAKVNKKPIVINAKGKTYKVKAKSKKYVVSLSTIVGSSANGKAYLKSGKTVTLDINGKTYTGKTNAKGQVTFKLKLKKKGKYTGVITFKEDNCYNGATKKVKIKIK